MRLLFWLTVAVLAAVLALFAASNRQVVPLGLWPLPYIAELPLYLAVLGALAIGALLGAVMSWGAGHRRRRQARRQRRHIAALERELAATQAQLPNEGERQPPQPTTHR